MSKLAPPILGYDQSASEPDSITHDERDGIVRVATPPLKRWGRIRRGYRYAILGLAGMVLILMTALLPGTNAPKDIGSFIAIGEYVVILAIVAACAFLEANQSFSFEVTRDTVRIRRLLRGFVARSWIYRRDRITSVRVNRFNGKLLLARIGEDPIEFYISPERADAERVAAILDAALHAELGPIDPKTPEFVSEAEQRRTPAQRNAIVYIVIVCAAVVAVYVGWLTNPGLGFFVFLGVLMPLGIVLGTQDRKTYL